VFVAFQTHFARGLADLVEDAGLRGDAGLRALVTLSRRRDPDYYRGWRRTYATAGGVLHQQAIHGVALALRWWPPGDAVAACRSVVVHRRRWKAVEDEVHAVIRFASGRELQIAASVDSPADARHTLVLQGSSGRVVVVDGRNLEYGVLDGSPPRRVTHEELRAELYRALITVVRGGPAHRLLYPLASLPWPLEVLRHVYQCGDRDDRSAAEPPGRAAV
jgi:predicted dehydrogenase